MAVDITENVELSKGLKVLAKSSMIVLIGLIFSKIFTYAYRVIIARTFGPEVYGLLSISIMVEGWLTAFFSLGLADGLVRYISFYRSKNKPDIIKYLTRHSLILTSITGAIAGLALFFLAEPIAINLFNNAGLIIYLKFFSIVIPSFLLMRLFLSVIRGFERISAYSFILNILQTGISLTALIILLYLGLPPNKTVIFSYLSGIFLSLLTAYVFCKIKFPYVFHMESLKKSTKTKALYSFLSYSWPLMFFLMFFKVLTWIDTFSIGYFKDAISVGFYNVAFPIAALFSFIPQIFTQLFFPLVTREYSKNNLEIIQKLSKQVSKWIFMVNLPLFIIVFLFPEEIISILFGKSYIIAGSALRILSVIGITSNFVVLSQNLISMTGKSKVILFNLVIAAILNGFLNILLVPRYGINGAAFSTAVVWSFLGIILILEVKHYLGFFPLKSSLLKMLLISAVPSLILLYLKNSLEMNITYFLLLAISLLLIYLLLLLTTGCLDKNDILILKSAADKLSRKKKNLGEIFQSLDK